VPIQKNSLLKKFSICTYKKQKPPNTRWFFIA